MLPLIVCTTDTRSGEQKHRAFGQSPVRLGRNQLNEVVLDYPFVSQWHAVVRFTERDTVYIDLGSTNGTTLGDAKLEQQQEVPTRENTPFRIGSLELTFSRGPAAPSMFGAHLGRAFRADGAIGDEDATRTDPTSHVGEIEPETNPFGLSDDDGALPAETLAVGAVHTATYALQQLRPFFRHYRESYRELHDEIRTQLSQMPDAHHASALAAMVETCPELAREPAFRQLAATVGVGPSTYGELDPAQWISRLTGEPHVPEDTQVNSQVAMERVGAILENFAQTYVELRNGYDEFAKEMNLPRSTEFSDLHAAQTGQAVLRYLLARNADGAQRLRELKRSFADLGLHQVALLNGVVEGARAILNQVSPAWLSGTIGGAMAKDGPAVWFERLFNLRKAELWKRFITAHAALMDRDRFARELFGHSFVHAYLTVTGEMTEPTQRRPRR